ncbi:hypothetical protein [Mycobacterium tuberculosis]|nr:hypothetical protein [Mycobacterium tuberculosis]
MAMRCAVIVGPTVTEQERGSLLGRCKLNPAFTTEALPSPCS